MEIVVWDLARALRARGHEIEVLTTRCAGLPEQTVEEGIAVRTLDVPEGRYSRAWWQRSAAAYEAEYRRRVDLVMGAGRATNAIALRRAPGGPPLALQIHGTMWSWFVANLFDLRPISWAKAAMDLRDVFQDRALASHDQLIAVGPAVERRMTSPPMSWLARGVPIALIPNGIDERMFAFDPQARAALRAELEVPEHGRLIVSAGRLDPHKGVRQGLTGFARALRANPGLRLAIVGDGPAREDLQAHAAQLGIAGATHFAGSVPRRELPAWLSAADAFLFSVIRPEGLPMVLLEAAACGLPTVQSSIVDVPGLPSISIDPDDPDDVARGLGAVLAGGPAGRSSRLPARHSFDGWASAYERLFETLIARSPEAR